MKHIIIGTAGHVDHGKTCLTRALTGVDTDRLKEAEAGHHHRDRFCPAHFAQRADRQHHRRARP